MFWSWCGVGVYSPRAGVESESKILISVHHCLELVDFAAFFEETSPDTVPHEVFFRRTNALKQLHINFFQKQLHPKLIHLKCFFQKQLCPHTAVLLLALYNYLDLVAPRLVSLYNVWFHFTRFTFCSGCVSYSSSTHRAPGKKATVPIYKVLVRPGRESNSRPTSTEVDALTTRTQASPGSPE